MDNKITIVNQGQITFLCKYPDCMFQQNNIQGNALRDLFHQVFIRDKQVEYNYYSSACKFQLKFIQNAIHITSLNILIRYQITLGFTVLNCNRS